MNRKLFRSIFLTALTVMVLSVVIILPVLQHHFTAEKSDALATLGKTLAVDLNVPGRNNHKAQTDTAYLKRVSRENSERITLIAKNGRVLYDSNANAATMDNHKNRPEVKAALKGGSGTASRMSKTLSESTYYYALRLKDGRVLRLGDTRMNLLGLFGSSLSIIAFLLIVVVVLAFIVSDIESRYILKPINRLDLDHPLDNDTYDELSPLLVRLDRQHAHIERQMAELSAKQQEFEAITNNMGEGLIIISHAGRVLSVNRAALNHFDLEDMPGGSYMALSRNADYMHVVKRALAGTGSEREVEKDGRYYRLTTSPVVVDSPDMSEGRHDVQDKDKRYGVALFITDITDNKSSERLRRDFTANVSHELKTPLTAIRGYAEIIAGGIAEPKDVPAFSHKIMDESDRLLKLISDIIRLSQLDEQAMDEAAEPVDLKVLAEQAVADLDKKAAEKQVTVKLIGNSTPMTGLRTTLYEMIYNLVDNAISYNKKDGSVTVMVGENDDDKPYIRVSDTGIGIAPEDQPRIYERFFRVDKSHSKATGGTGLGLSIVKHGAIVHRAKIALVSKPGEGSTFTVTFPKKMVNNQQ